MSHACSDPLDAICVYAILPSADRDLVHLGRGQRLVAVGPIAALTGKSTTHGDVERRALAHDRVVLRALAACSSVVPFRLGTTLPGEAAVVRVLERNRDSLAELLRRFAGRVEMGLKIRLPDDDAATWAGAPAALTRQLTGIHRLTADSEDRREQVRHGAAGAVFEGSYLIPRGKIDDFWSRTDILRARAPSLPMLASGPYAPYSFCGWLHREAVA